MSDSTQPRLEAAERILKAYGITYVPNIGYRGTGALPGPKVEHSLLVSPPKSVSGGSDVAGMLAHKPGFLTLQIPIEGAKYSDISRTLHNEGAEWDASYTGETDELVVPKYMGKPRMGQTAGPLRGDWIMS